MTAKDLREQFEKETKVYPDCMQNEPCVDKYIKWLGKKIIDSDKAFENGYRLGFQDCDNKISPIHK